jgi:hypothetical protein
MLTRLPLHFHLSFGAAPGSLRNEENDAMAAGKQYADALKALEVLEKDYLDAGRYLTYGALCEAVGYKPLEHARHIGQVCSLIDAACFWARLPFLSLEKVRLEGGGYNPDSFSGAWSQDKEVLIGNAKNHAWIAEDIDKVRGRLLKDMREEAAKLQWEKIYSHGNAALDKARTLV